MKRVILYLSAAIFLGSCGTSGKIHNLKISKTGTEINVSNGDMQEFRNEVLSSNETSDTLTVRGINGEKLHLMSSITDSSGNICGTQNLSGVVVNAKFKNIAERGGKIKLAFDIHVPAKLQDPRWQLRFKPRIIALGDTINLAPIHITGIDYHQEQIRGYELYSRYLSNIITDSTQLRYQKLVEIFIERNIPALSDLKRDTSVIKPEKIHGLYDISYREVLDYYEKKLKISRNNQRVENAPKAFDRYVKDSPPDSDSVIRLDTLITQPKDFFYCYTETIDTKPDLRKVEINIDGEIMKNGESLYSIPEGKPLTFYISSISTLLDSYTLPGYDTSYTEGVAALKGRHYEKALKYLKHYEDLNTAVAYLCLDNDIPARNILEKLPESAKKDYMLALISAREGEERRAIQLFINSLVKDKSMRFRANLDPEIKHLVKKYNLNLEDNSQLNIN